jgi:hypothetical protein
LKEDLESDVKGQAFLTPAKDKDYGESPDPYSDLFGILGNRSQLIAIAP